MDDFEEKIDEGELKGNFVPDNGTDDVDVDADSDVEEDELVPHKPKEVFGDEEEIDDNFSAEFIEYAGLYED